MSKKYFLFSLLILAVFLTGCKKQTSETNNSVKLPQEMTLEERKQASLEAASRKALEDAGFDPDNMPAVEPEPDFHVFWYNPKEDTKNTCDGRYFVHSSPRYVESQENLITQAMRELFSADLTAEEKATGFSGIPFSEIDFEIKSINLNEEGVLYIDFVDNRVLGNWRDECWGSTFVTTVHHTAQQFSEINRVLFDRAFDIPIRNF